MKTIIALAALATGGMALASSANPAGPEALSISLSDRLQSERIQVDFESRRNGADSQWSDGFAPSELAGLDRSAVRSSGSKPVRFAVTREAGRVDCSGQGGSGTASGTCSATGDPAFLALLRDRGIEAPAGEQLLGLISLDVRRSLVEALAAARYPVPSLDELFGLTALGVDAAYIQALSSAGYRPPTLSTLMEFKALEIDAAYVRGMREAGYANLSPAELVQLKALDVTPDFARSAASSNGIRPSPDELITRKIFARDRVSRNFPSTAPVDPFVD